MNPVYLITAYILIHVLYVLTETIAYKMKLGNKYSVAITYSKLNLISFCALDTTLSICGFLILLLLSFPLGISYWLGYLLVIIGMFRTGVGALFLGYNFIWGEVPLHSIYEKTRWKASVVTFCFHIVVVLLYLICL